MQITTKADQVPQKQCIPEKNNDIGMSRGILKSTPLNMQDTFLYATQKEKQMAGLQWQGLKSVDELKNLASATDLGTYQDQMIFLAHSVSKEDLGKLYEEGMQASINDVKETVSIVDLIKLTEAKCGKIIAGYNDNISKEVVLQATKSASMAAMIEHEMESAGLSGSKEYVKEIENAINMGMEISSLDDSMKEYLINNQLEPTIEHVFTAKFAGKNMQKAEGYRYETDRSGYINAYGANQKYQATLSDLEKLLDKNGILPTEEAIQNASWFMEKEIPISQKNMELLSQINQIQAPFTQEELLQKILQGNAEGRTPKATLLVESTSIYEKANDYLERFENLSEEAVEWVEQKNLPLTLTSLEYCEAIYRENQNTSVPAKNLADHQLGNGNSQTSQSGQTNLSSLSSKRILEEVRLTMTAKANVTLLKAGISIDTLELGKLVDALKLAEKKSLQELHLEELHLQEGQAEILQNDFEESFLKLREMPAMPLYLVGASFKHEVVTLDDYYAEGQQLKKRLEAAKEQYETYMTVAKAEYGDKLEKAFSNMEELLKEAQIEVSEENIRATKILAYAHVEISNENLETIKTADSKLSYVLSELNPAMTLDLIRKGENPMKMSMDALIDQIDEYTDSPETQHMRFSKFLYGLDLKKEISQEERAKFIEVYHVLKQVEKTQGAPIGNCLSTGAELTLENIQKAYEASKKQMDYSLENGDVRVSKYVRDVKSISHSLHADALLEGKNIHENVMDFTIEELKELCQIKDSSLENYLSEEQKILSLAEEVSIYTNQLESLGITVSMENLFAYGTLKEQRGAFYREYEKSLEKNSSHETSTDLADDFLEEIENFHKNLGISDEMESSYHQLLNNMQDSIMETIENADGYIDLKQMMLLGKQVGILKALESQKEYEIPVFMQNQLTSVHVTLDTQSEQKGVVKVTTSLKDGGNVGASFEVIEKEVFGYVAINQPEEEAYLKEVLERMKEKFATTTLSVKQLQIVPVKELELHKFEGGVNEKNRVTSQELYKVAEVFLTSL